jgi:hypothetical protein
MNADSRKFLDHNPDVDVAFLVYKLREMEQCACDDCESGLRISEVLREAGVPETDFARERRLKMEAYEARVARESSALFYVRERYPSAYGRYDVGKCQIYDQIARKAVFECDDRFIGEVWQQFATTLGWKYEEPKP